MFDLFAGLLVLTAAAAYVNHRYFKLPDAIGVMAFALVFSVGIVAVRRFVPHWQAAVRSFVIRLEFRDTVLHGMLAFLLFAAEALHLSAPLAVVVAGVLTGNPARSRAMSAKTVERLDGFGKPSTTFSTACFSC